MNTSWWRAALAAPAVVPDFSVIRAHVCGMPARVDKHHLSPCQTLLSGNWTYFPEACRERGEASATSPEFGKGIDGVGHFGQFIVDGIRERRGAPPRLARFFGESASVAGAYFVGVVPHLQYDFASSNGLDRNLSPRFENSTRAIDSSKNQPNRRRCDRDGEF